MATSTTNYSFNLPVVASAVDADLWGTQLNANWTSIDTLLKAASDVASSGAARPGFVQAYAGASAPTGWLLCDGSAISRTTYADLFAAIGTTYGVGDGSTTFNIPNLRRKMAYGADGSSGFALGDSGGAETVSFATDGHTLTIDEMPSHKHTYLQSNTSGGGPQAGGGGSGATSRDTSSTGGGDPHAHDITDMPNLPPYLALNYIIKT